jgi:hypothetical protein
MTTKERIIAIIRDIEDENILRNLEDWIKEMDIEKRERKSTSPDKVNELDETYKTRVDKSKTHTSGEKLQSEPQRAMYWLKKIADSGGIQSIKDPVTWQKDIRKDRSLSLY